MQLVAYGAQDIYLTGNPQITFFKVVYRRHTNFSMESIKQSINGYSQIYQSDGNNVNNKATVTISRNGDLITSIYVVCNIQDRVNGVCGDELVEDVEIEIGGQRIDKHYKEWNQIWNELTTPVSKCDGYKYMTGSFSNGMVTLDGTRQQSIHYPLNFWFCRNPGLALPLIALQYHEVQLKITWGTLDNIIRNSVYDSTNDDMVNIMEVWVDYIYLDTDERRRFSQVSHEYLIEQLQVQKEKDMENKEFKLNLEHPIKEIIWTTPENKPIDDAKIKLNINGHDRFSERTKEYFTLVQPYKHHTSIPGYNIKETDNPLMVNAIENSFSGAVNTITHEGDDLVIKLSEEISTGILTGDIVNILNNNDDVSIGITQINNIDRSEKKIYIDHNHIPDFSVSNIVISVLGRTQGPKSRCSQLKKDIYVYSFCLDPEEHQPSGTCNFSRIDSAKILFDKLTSISNIYAINYNILRIMSGMGGLAYSS